MADSGDKNYINKDYIRKPGGLVVDADHLFNQLRSGDVVALSRSITLIESELEDDQLLGGEILKLCLPHSGHSQRIGITGVPGAGKSTFIEAFGKHLTSLGNKVAVLAIDPTSAKNKGSILGDKTRMNELSVDPLAYIRPSPSVGALGGVARKTRESIILCEAAGYNKILVETVGVGQSETEVHSMTDLFLLIMIAGAGDELQGIKRGIMEMADVLIINKDDGDNKAAAKRARTEYTAALHLFPRSASGWIPKVVTCSSIERSGIAELYDLSQNYFNHITTTGYLSETRNKQAIFWLHQSINERLMSSLYGHPGIKKELEFMESVVISGHISAYEAAIRILDLYKKSTK
jgi:LAO/AO transport system kinase